MTTYYHLLSSFSLLLRRIIQIFWMKTNTLG
nr:MAG TPA: hypothetical protein [Caudoviricetes sp.]